MDNLDSWFSEVDGVRVGTSPIPHLVSYQAQEFKQAYNYQAAVGSSPRLPNEHI